MNDKFFIRMIIFPVLLMLWGCLESSLTFQVRYEEISGLKQDDPVYFEQNKIGKVEKVTYTQQGDYLVAVSIDPEFKNAATVDSKFFIDTDRTNRQNKAVNILQETPGGRLLQKGAVVQGSVRTGLLDDMLGTFKRSTTVAAAELQEAIQQLVQSLDETSQKLDREMASTLDNLSRQLQNFSLEVKKAPDSNEVKQLEESIKQFSDEFSKAQENVRNHIRHRVLPQIRMELDRLRQKLQKEGRDGEIEVIDRQIDEMSRI